MQEQPKLSLVIPVLNEAPNLEALHQELKEALMPLRFPYEIIFIDDGSTDGSLEVMGKLM
jgi:dolichol-phosphate mannosyltransferase